MSSNLYNERPSWLVEAHRNLDATAFEAYGWPLTLTDVELLERSLALNHPTPDFEKFSLSGPSLRLRRKPQPMTPQF